MSLSDLSDMTVNSSDEEEGPPRLNLRIFRDRMNPIDHYSDFQFRDRYRLSKAVVYELLQLLDDLGPFTRRNRPLSALEQLLLTMHFYASGGFQITVADNVRIHKSTACRIIKKVSAAIAKLRPHYIKMPSNEEERSIVKTAFYNIAGFPNVIGAIDCTHVKIQSPGGPTAERFRNRKNYFSLNVQCVCDAKLKIRDIVARWQGSVHDTTIFNDSHLRADLERRVYGNDFLLGDSGYPCRSYLLTPFLNPSTTSEEAYNNAQIATRNTIERCFGVLKRRFPCLSMGLRVKLDTAMKIIVACAVLHNFAIANNDMYYDNFDEDAAIMESPEPYPDVRNENTAVRASLLLTHFNV